MMSGVTISDVKEIRLEINNSNRVDSIFLDKGVDYKGFVKDFSKPIELPMTNMTPNQVRSI